MFKEKIDKLKNIIAKRAEGNNKKNIENLVVFLILLIITIIAINSIWGGSRNDTEEDDESSYKLLASHIDEEITSTKMESTEYNLERELEEILSKIAGVGRVKTLITYSETSRVVAMYNEQHNSRNTEETDSNGGTRNIIESDTKRDIVFEQKNGESTPITEKIIMPRIEGAIIIAEGASNITIKTGIIQAVSAVTGLSSNRVQVFEMEE